MVAYTSRMRVLAINTFKLSREAETQPGWLSVWRITTKEEEEAASRSPLSKKTQLRLIRLVIG
jgi:hypothetical protein